MFDLPTETSEDRKSYRKFRKFLIGEGFIMHQYSVYSKILLNDTAEKTMVGRLKKELPSKGSISILSVTEKQFSKMQYLVGEKNLSVANSTDKVIHLGGED